MMTRTLLQFIKQAAGIPSMVPQLKAPGMPTVGGPGTLTGGKPKMQAATVKSVITPNNTPGGQLAPGRQAQQSIGSK